MDASQENSASHRFPALRLLLSAVVGATLCSFPCAIVYELIANADSFGGLLVFLFGLIIGAIGGALIGVSVSLRAHRPSLLAVAAFLMAAPILWMWLTR
jgi:hypothetical protein